MSGFWEGRRVLVTGHSGFKGSWLALWLHALGAEAAVAATVSWYDEVRDGSDARAVTLTQIEGRT